MNGRKDRSYVVSRFDTRVCVCVCVCRYVDLIVNPEVADVFRKRAKVSHPRIAPPTVVRPRVDSWLHARPPQITRVIRRHMEDTGFVEIETPVLQVHMGLGFEFRV